MRTSNLRLLLLASTTLCLAGCGGGGGSGVGGELVSTPPPPTGSTSVQIFASPATQQFVDSSTGTDLDVRYNSTTGFYEVTAGPLPWTKLVDDPYASPTPGHPNKMFALDGAGPNQSYFMIRAHPASPSPDNRYSYSNLAVWGASAAITGGANISGYSAIGIATPPGAVPVAGSASYQGMIEGSSTVDFQYDIYTIAGSIGGSVSLDFDFGSGTLAGLIQPYLYTDQQYPLPSLSFTNTMFGVGSTTFSGLFATGLAGPNGFSGQFTGPNAQELIGQWAFPFISPVDGALESGEGVWIAKKP